MLLASSVFLAMSALDLCEACAEGDHEGARILLNKKKVPVNCRDGSAWTPLLNAANAGDEKMIMLLLACPGCDVNATDKSGTTAFMLAALSGNIKAVELLLVAPGIDIKKKDNAGKMAVDYAKQRGIEEVYKLVHKETFAEKMGAAAKRISSRISLRK